MLLEFMTDTLTGLLDTAALWGVTPLWGGRSLPRHRKFSKVEMEKHDHDWGELIHTVRAACRRYEQACLRGNLEQASRVYAEIQEYKTPVSYAYGQWRRHGSWPRYFQVNGGLLHTTITCRTINVHTIIKLLSHLSGVPLEVVRQDWQLCRHCGHIATGDVPDEWRMRVLRQWHLIRKD